jgi:hypothetical protein
MIVVSAGMQKAGTGWYFNLTNDLLVAAGHQDVRVLRERFHLQRLMKHGNCNIGRPILPRLAVLLSFHLLGNTYVVKTHSRPTPSLRALVAAGVARITYVYRDPRDAAISAYDHGCRLRRHKQTHTFARLKTMESAILSARDWVQTWERWIACRGVLATRYEDLLVDPLRELQQLARHLSIKVPAEQLKTIVARYQMKEGGAVQGPRVRYSLHFNKGVAGRFREVLSAEEIALCNEVLGDHLQEMGYRP